MLTIYTARNALLRVVSPDNRKEDGNRLSSDHEDTEGLC